jgi:peptidyl-tRNA hydrolase
LEFIDNMKLIQAIIVRTDLGMGKGKIAGQVVHAAVEAAESIRRYCPERVSVTGAEKRRNGIYGPGNRMVRQH